MRVRSWGRVKKRVRTGVRRAIGGMLDSFSRGLCRTARRTCWREVVSTSLMPRRSGADPPTGRHRRLEVGEERTSSPARLNSPVCTKSHPRQGRGPYDCFMPGEFPSKVPRSSEAASGATALWYPIDALNRSARGHRALDRQCAARGHGHVPEIERFKHRRPKVKNSTVCLCEIKAVVITVVCDAYADRLNISAAAGPHSDTLGTEARNGQRDHQRESFGEGVGDARRAIKTRGGVKDIRRQKGIIVYPRVDHPGPDGLKAVDNRIRVAMTRMASNNESIGWRAHQAQRQTHRPHQRESRFVSSPDEPEHSP
jgi:hypothetical protein